MTTDTIKNMIRYFIVLALIFPIFAGIPSGAAQAQKIMEQFEKELPTYPPLPIEEFEEKTEPHDVVPFNDKELTYSINLPKGWSENEDKSLNNYTVSDKVLGEIAEYYSPARAGGRSRFTIEALEIKYEISALHWFMNYALTNSLSLEGVKEYTKSKVEALYIVVEKDVNYAVRTVAQISGNRIILAKFYTPFTVWNEERALQNQVMNTFDLKYPKSVNIEKLKSMIFLDVAEMQYPESWYLKDPNTRSVDEMSVRLVNLNEINVLNGKIDVNIISTYSEQKLEERYEWHKKEIEKTGLQIKGLIGKEEDNFEFHPEMDFAFVDAYAAQNKVPYIINYELWIAVMAGEGYFYYVTLLTPSRDDEFFVWSRNVEAFKILVKNIGPQEILIYDE